MYQEETERNWMTVNSPRTIGWRWQGFCGICFSPSLSQGLSAPYHEYYPNEITLSMLPISVHTLRMHSANVTFSSYRARRMITIFTTSSRILRSCIRPWFWSTPRHRIFTHLAKSAPYFGFISAPPRSDFRTWTFHRRAFTNSI